MKINSVNFSLEKNMFLWLVAMVLFSCSPSLFAQTEENKSLNVIVFGKLPPPESITRIVSAGPVSDPLLVSLAPKKLLGISGNTFESGYKKYFPKEVGSLPSTGRIANRASTFPFEKLVALKPNMVIDLGNTSETYISTAERVYRQTGIPYVLVDGRLADTAQQIREVARLVGEEERGAVLANFADQILTDAARVREDKTKKKIKVFYGRGANGLETGLPGSIHTEVLDLLGAENAAASAGENIIGKVSMEQLMQWQPDVIVTVDPGFYQELEKGSGVWGKINAVKHKRFYLAPSQPLGWLDRPPSLNRLLGVIWMRRLLYPETMPEDYFHEQIQTYYKLFYGYDLKSESLKKILGDPEGWPTL